MSADDYRKYLSGEGALAYQRAQDEAANDHVFGVPLFIFENEPFWGHDRIPVLGKSPHRNLAGLAPQSDSLLLRWRRVRVEDQLLRDCSDAQQALPHTHCLSLGVCLAKQSAISCQRTESTSLNRSKFAKWQYYGYP